MAGWDTLRQLFIDNGLQELADVITESIQNKVKEMLNGIRAGRIADTHAWNQIIRF